MKVQLERLSKLLKKRFILMTISMKSTIMITMLMIIIMTTIMIMSMKDMIQLLKRSKKLLIRHF